MTPTKPSNAQANIDILIAVAQKGGVENVVNMTVSYLRENGYYARVVQLVWEGVAWTADDTPFYPLLQGREGHDLAELSDAYQNFLQSDEGKAHPPDLILACAWPYMTYIAKNVAVNLQLDLRVVSWLHGPVERYMDAGYGGFEALRFADAHFAISDAIFNGIRKNINNQTIYRINNPVNFPPAAEGITDAAQGANRLYFIGRLSVNKHADVVVRALAKSSSQYELYVVGDGEGDERKRLSALAGELGVADRVHLVGWRAQPWDEVRDAAAVVIASLYEGFPLVAIEALSRGIPVISTPVDGITEIVQPGVNGYLFPFEDADALAKIFDAMAQKLFPPIDPAACASSVAAFEKNLTLRDFALKTDSVLTDRQRLPALPRLCKTILYADVKISVIVPCYNVEAYVEECLDSLLAQTFPKELTEIILVNDASTDGTLAILQRYEAAYPDLFLLVNCEENGGQGNARNVGMSYASGDYLTFVDSDDRVFPNMLSEMYEKAALYDCDLVFGSSRMFNRQGYADPTIMPEAFFDLISPEIRKEMLLIYGYRYGNPPWGKLYRTTFLLENQIVFPVRLRMEDVAFHQEVLLTARRVFVSDKVFYEYRINENGIMLSKGIKDYYMDIFRVQDQFYSRWKETHPDDPYRDELALIYYAKGFVAPMEYMQKGAEFDIAYSAENAALLKNTLLKHFPDILENPYILQDQSDYNRQFLDLLRES